MSTQIHRLWIALTLASGAISSMAFAKTPVEATIEYVKAVEATLSKDITNNPGTAKDLAIDLEHPGRGSFIYELAYQGAQFYSYGQGRDKSPESMIFETPEIFIPFCHQRNCILVTFQQDKASGAIELVSYGAARLADRIATGYQRLKTLRPGYDGPVKIVEYPGGKYEFLLVDSEEPGQKTLLLATEEQSRRAARSLLKGKLVSAGNEDKNGVDFLTLEQAKNLIRVTDEGQPDQPQNQTSDPQLVPRQPLVKADQATAGQAPASQATASQAPASQAPASQINQPVAKTVAPMTATVAPSFKKRPESGFFWRALEVSLGMLFLTLLFWFRGRRKVLSH